MASHHGRKTNGPYLCAFTRMLNKKLIGEEYTVSSHLYDIYIKLFINRQTLCLKIRMHIHCKEKWGNNTKFRISITSEGSTGDEIKEGLVCSFLHLKLLRDTQVLLLDSTFSLLSVGHFITYKTKHKNH